MADQLMQIPRQNDKAIIKCFRALANEYNIAEMRVTIIGVDTVDIDIRDKSNSLLQSLEKNNVDIIDNLSTAIEGLQISYHRGGVLYFNSQHKEKSPFHDEIKITTNQYTTLDKNKIVEVITTISKEFNSFVAGQSVGKLSKEQVQLEALHNATLNRLESLSEELISKTHQYREELTAEFRNKTQELENDYAKKVAEDEAIIATIKSSLEEEKTRLEDRKVQLDDRDNTHARREIRRDILKEIKERQKEFTLTKGTKALRLPIHFLMALLIGYFVGMSFSNAITMYQIDLFKDTQITLILSIKQIFYMLGTVGSILFYIKWANKWFEQHSSAEFQMKQFELDMERASWLVETSLEWNDKKGNEMPPELLKSLANNLFEIEKTKNEPVLHPADQLASALLGSATAVKLKAGESMIEIDPKKLAKQKNPNE